MTPGQFVPKPGVPEAPIRAGAPTRSAGTSWGLAGRCSCKRREDEGAEDARAGQEQGGINHSWPQGAAALPALRREIFPAKPSSPTAPRAAPSGAPWGRAGSAGSVRVPWLGCGRREKQSRRSRGQGKGKKQLPPALSTAPCPTPRCAWAEGWQELKRRHQGALGSTGGGGEEAGGSLLAAGIGFGSRKAQPSAFTPHCSANPPGFWQNCSERGKAKTFQASNFCPSSSFQLGQERTWGSLCPLCPGTEPALPGPGVSCKEPSFVNLELRTAQPEGAELRLPRQT